MYTGTYFIIYVYTYIATTQRASVVDYCFSLVTPLSQVEYLAKPDVQTEPSIYLLSQQSNSELES